MDNNTAATPGVSPGPPPALDLNKLIDHYVQLRDRKRLMESQHKEALKPFNALMEEIEGRLLKHMHDTGATSIATPGGSAYQTTKKSATIKDGSAFRTFVVSNQKFELVDWRANAIAVFDFIKESGGQPPPGVNASTYVSVGVRRPNEEDQS